MAGPVATWYWVDGLVITSSQWQLITKGSEWSGQTGIFVSFCVLINGMILASYPTAEDHCEETCFFKRQFTLLPKSFVEFYSEWLPLGTTDSSTGSNISHLLQNSFYLSPIDTSCHRGTWESGVWGQQGKRVTDIPQIGSNEWAPQIFNCTTHLRDCRCDERRRRRRMHRLVGVYWLCGFLFQRPVSGWRSFAERDTDIRRRFLISLRMCFFWVFLLYSRSYPLDEISRRFWLINKNGDRLSINNYTQEWVSWHIQWEQSIKRWAIRFHWDTLTIDS